MVHKAHTDHGTVLRPDQAAFIGNADGSYSLLLPDFPDGQEYSEAHLLVVAVAARLTDDDFREELMDFLRDRHAELRGH
ncbi:MAG: hypothetical protein WBW73_23110 [Rhodoplanes sp.]